MARLKVFIAPAASALFILAACATSKGTVPASMASSASVAPVAGTLIHGFVRSVDDPAQRVPFRHSLIVDRGYGQNLTIEYKAMTPVSFNGGWYAPTDLEAGDEVDILTRPLGSGRLRAREITVIKTTNGISELNPPGTMTTLSTLHGTVRAVDRSHRTLTLDTGRRETPTTIVRYDPDVDVDYNGQDFLVENIEPGDTVDVRVQSSGQADYLAQRIVVVRVNGR
jgi:hypothetical protein